MGYVLIARAQEPQIVASASPENPGTYSQQFVSDVSAVPPITPKAKGPYSPYPSSCLASVQYWLPDFPKGIGFPDNIEPNQAYPTVGAAVITSEGRVGHIGEVLDVRVNPGGVEALIQECNMQYNDINKNGQRDPGEPGVCSYRTLDAEDPRIRGYWVN